MCIKYPNTRTCNNDALSVKTSLVSTSKNMVYNPNNIPHTRFFLNCSFSSTFYNPPNTPYVHLNKYLIPKLLVPLLDRIFNVNCVQGCTTIT